MRSGSQRHLAATIAGALVALSLLLAACSSERTVEVDAGGSTTPSAAEFIDDLFSGDYYRSAIVKGTEQHLVRLTDGSDLMDLYTFDGDFADRGLVACWATNHLDTSAGNGGSTAGCAESLDPEPQLVGGASGSSDTDTWQHTAGLVWAPANAAWFRVELSNGDEVTANVATRASMIGWEGDESEYVKRAFALDADSNELWSEEFDAPPVLPGQ